MDRPRSEVLRASPPLFASSRLDAFTRCRAIVPPLVYVPVIVLLAVLGARGAGLWQAGVAFLGGYAFWTFCEYWIHRVVFHLEPRSELGARLHWIFHGVHHDHPSDPMRLVMPPIVTVPLAAGFLGVFVLVFGTSLGFAVGAGFFAGYLFYDMLHYALHHRRPKSRVGKRLHELHMRHHFQDEERCFGVSAPWWDTVFGTAATRRSSGRR